MNILDILNLWPPFDGVAGPAGYNLYKGVGSPTAIDWDTPVASFMAGGGHGTLTGLTPLEDTDYWFGLGVVSSRGVETLCQDRQRLIRLRIEDGQLVGQPPNAPAFARAVPAAGGGARVEYSYRAEEQLAPPAAIQVAEWSVGLSDYDWTDLRATIAISGSARGSVLLAKQWADAAPIKLAARVLGRVVGPILAGLSGVYAMAEVAADATAPDDVEVISASQA